VEEIVEIFLEVLIRRGKLRHLRR
jgi:hypothetical protein